MWNGILLIDKPIGKTSHDVVYLLKKLTKASKVGHAGTLDPLASGLLILLFGQATRLSNQYMAFPKTYEGVIELGKTSVTFDAEGPIVNGGEVPEFTQEWLTLRLQSFLGQQEQLPPMFSAKKVQGKSLYKLARKGIEVERKPHSITVYHWNLIHYEKPFIHFSLKCSKGTYVRILAHDLGQKLGCGAYLKALSRTQIGPFLLSKVCPWSWVEQKNLEEIQNYLQPYNLADN